MDTAPEGARVALVTGVSGQDGVLLARHLSSRGVRVVGTIRPGTRASDPYLVYLDDVDLVEHDVRDADGFRSIVDRHGPAEVYNLASFSAVGASWDHPELVAAVNGDAVEQMLESLRGTAVRFFQASSAEELNGGESPYAEAKRRASAAVAAARDDGLFASAGVLHNHESPLRPPTFVTRKITRAAAEVALGKRETVTLGNLEVHRDWGAATDYVEAMALMLGHDEPVDLPIGTGVLHSLRDLVTEAFTAAGVPDGLDRVEQSPEFTRPADSRGQAADPEPAAAALGWRATTSFAEVIGSMVAVDVERLRTGVEESPAYLAR